MGKFTVTKFFAVFFHGFLLSHDSVSQSVHFSTGMIKAHHRYLGNRSQSSIQWCDDHPFISSHGTSVKDTPAYSNFLPTDPKTTPEEHSSGTSCLLFLIPDRQTRLPNPSPSKFNVQAQGSKVYSRSWRYILPPWSQCVKKKITRAAWARNLGAFEKPEHMTLWERLLNM